MSGPRIGSLFSGYGGLEQGVQAVLGGSTAWVSDIDKGACKILAHRYPDVPNLGDISAVDWSAVEPVDVLTGGFPCQDVSHAGKRAGLRPDTRTGLWSQMAYAIDQLRPALVVAENVRGLLSAEAHSDLEPCPWCMGDGSAGSPLRALGAVLGDLADIGYDASWYGLRAADVGAPHGRFRVFVVAYPAGDEGRLGYGDGGAARHAHQPRLEGHGLDGERAGERAAWAAGSEPTLLKTPTSQLAVNGGSQHPDKRKAGGHGPTLADEVEHLLPTPAVNDMGAAYTPDEWDAWTDRMKAEHGNGNGHGKSLSIEAARLVYDESRCVECGCPEHLHDGGGFCAGRCGGEMCGDRNYVARLLPTPKATNNENRQSLDQYGMNLGQALGVTPLLPTPSVADSEGGHERRGGARGDELLLNGVAKGLANGSLLGTPTATMTQRSGRFAEGREANPNEFARGYAGTWGEYAAAIARWEALTRPVPAPTQWTEQYVRERARRLAGKDKRPVGRRGSLKPRPQLSPAFVEWMMGLPAGWVTDVPGITRNEALKALGNGVVPQQAEAALRFLLSVQAVAA